MSVPDRDQPCRGDSTVLHGDRIELATALYFEMEADYFEEAYSALVVGYLSQRALPDEQLYYMPLFFLTRSFTYLVWVRTRFETETPVN